MNFNNFNIFNNTIYLSLYVQIATGILDMIAYFVKVERKNYILKELLVLELIVQIIEGSFYVWLVFNLKNISNVTPTRYFDWFITTPTMLITLVVYLIYLKDLNDTEEKKKIKDNEIYNEIDYNNKKELNFKDIMIENKDNLIAIVLLNALMLIFGYLGEINYINNFYAVILGFIPFLIYFKIIYDNYVVGNSDGNQIFYYFFIIWSLYGVAAFLPYYLKNTTYNILDLFSKNFFGVFLSWLIIKGSFSYE